MAELKACPLCGQPFIPVELESGWTYRHDNSCCPLYQNPIYDNGIWTSKDGMIEALNTRPIEDKQAELIEKLYVYVLNLENENNFEHKSFIVAKAKSAYRQWKEEQK